MLLLFVDLSNLQKKQVIFFLSQNQKMIQPLIICMMMFAYSINIDNIECLQFEQVPKKCDKKALNNCLEIMLKKYPSLPSRQSVSKSILVSNETLNYLIYFIHPSIYSSVKTINRILLFLFRKFLL